MIRPYSQPTLAKYRPWLAAAALYNFVWGILVIFWPTLLFEMWQVPLPNDMVLWQVTGMFVLVYAPAYWWAARRPETHYHFILIGFLGKFFGPVGFLWAASSGQLSLSFGWIILFNDIIWWPAFVTYLIAIFRMYGAQAILKGE